MCKWFVKAKTFSAMFAGNKYNSVVQGPNQHQENCVSGNLQPVAARISVKKGMNRAIIKAPNLKSLTMI